MTENNIGAQAASAMRELLEAAPLRPGGFSLPAVQKLAKNNLLRLPKHALHLSFIILQTGTKINKGHSV